MANLICAATVILACAGFISASAESNPTNFAQRSAMLFDGVATAINDERLGTCIPNAETWNMTCGHLSDDLCQRKQGCYAKDRLNATARGICALVSQDSASDCNAITECTYREGYAGPDFCCEDDKKSCGEKDINGTEWGSCCLECIGEMSHTIASCQIGYSVLKDMRATENASNTLINACPVVGVTGVDHGCYRCTGSRIYKVDTMSDCYSNGVCTVNGVAEPKSKNECQGTFQSANWSHIDDPSLQFDEGACKSDGAECFYCQGATTEDPDTCTGISTMTGLKLNWTKIPGPKNEDECRSMEQGTDNDGNTKWMELNSFPSINNFVRLGYPLPNSSELVDSCRLFGNSTLSSATPLLEHIGLTREKGFQNDSIFLADIASGKTGAQAYTDNKDYYSDLSKWLMIKNMAIVGAPYGHVSAFTKVQLTLQFGSMVIVPQIRSSAEILTADCTNMNCALHDQGDDQPKAHYLLLSPYVYKGSSSKISLSSGRVTVYEGRNEGEIEISTKNPVRVYGTKNSGSMKLSSATDVAIGNCDNTGSIDAYDGNVELANSRNLIGGNIQIHSGEFKILNSVNEGTVTINSGMFTISGSSNTGKIVVNGGTFHVSGANNGLIDVKAGKISGTITCNSNGTINIAAGVTGTVSISGGSDCEGTISDSADIVKAISSGENPTTTLDSNSNSGVSNSGNSTTKDANKVLSGVSASELSKILLSLLAAQWSIF